MWRITVKMKKITVRNCKKTGNNIKSNGRMPIKIVSIVKNDC